MEQITGTVRAIGRLVETLALRPDVTADTAVTINQKMVDDAQQRLRREAESNTSLEVKIAVDLEIKHQLNSIAANLRHLSSRRR